MHVTFVVLIAALMKFLSFPECYAVRDEISTSIIIYYRQKNLDVSISP